MQTLINRRTFVTSCAVSAAGLTTTIPASVLALDAPARRWLISLYTGEDGTLRDPRVRALTARALDAARSAGAQYADVRVTYARWRRVSHHVDSEDGEVRLGLSVRALVRGYWGWATTPLLTDDEVVRVGRTAAGNAQTLTKYGRERVVEWMPISTVQDGDWTTPIEVDPFTLPRREIAAFLAGEMEYVGLLGAGWNTPQGLRATFSKTDRVFASTEGSYGIQTRYVTGCGATLVVDGEVGSIGSVPLRSAGTAQAGWEFVRDQPWRTAIPSLMAEIETERRIPIEGPLDVGRYDLVFGAGVVASLLSATVGSATCIGRAIGSDANSLGVSYLGPHVLSMLGTPVASPLLSIMGDRSRPKAMATVPWDDEGVVPEPFPLITDGVLVDYLTTREQAPWLKDWYAKQGVAVRSRGCAAGRDAHAVLREVTPNLAMRPGSSDRSFDDLIADVGSGVAMRTVHTLDMDWQCLNGLAVPMDLYRIRNGKRAARIQHKMKRRSSVNALMFRAPELLKSIVAIGGERSVQWSNAEANIDGTVYSVGAVPMVVKQLTIIDPTRRA